MIEVQSLSKRYGSTLAVDDLSFTVQPGVVTGFLGPQRGREVDHHADGARPRPPDERHRHGQRPALRPVRGAAA